MNEHLPREIFGLLTQMSDDEITAFKKQNTAPKRGPKAKKESGFKYLQLFHCYLDQRDEPELNLPKIKRQSKAFTSSFNDLNQQLWDSLEKFIGQQKKKQEENSLERQIELNLFSIEALIEKKRLQMAAKKIEATAALLLEMKKDMFDEKCLYLSLRFAGQRYNFNLHLFLDSAENVYQKFDDEFVPFLVLARQAHENIVQRKPDQFRQLDTPAFDKVSLLSLIGIYLRERNDIEKLLQLITRKEKFEFSALFDNRRLKPEQSNSKNSNALIEKIVDTGEVMVLLEKLFLTIRANDWYEFDRTVHHILNDHKLFRQPESYNIHLAAFVYRQVFEMKLLYGGEAPPPMCMRSINWMN